ncbi:hypothetical protein ALON55S_01660 [Alishewanella longhuensis]
MREGLARGITQPKVVLTGFEQSISSYIAADAEQSVFFQPLQRKPDSLDEQQWQQFRQQAAELIRTQVNPAYQAFYNFMVADYLPEPAKILLPAHSQMVVLFIKTV